MKSKLSVLVLVVVLTVLAATPIAAAPMASPCTPGASYNPACDVNQDGAITILDVQLTAGHWNRTGTFTSDNSHNHLGQTWTGSNNPLALTGAFGAPLYSPLILSNSAGVGMRVTSTNSSGVYIDSAGGHGMVVSSASLNGVYVDLAANDGIFVCRTGNATSCAPNSSNNGVEIGNAQSHGVLVNSAGSNGVAVLSAFNDGLSVNSAGLDGVYVYSADYDGVRVVNAGGDGLFVSTAGQDGVYANTSLPSGQWGLYTPDAIHGSNVLLQSLSLVAQVSGPDGLTPGDIVAVAGVTDPVSGSAVYTPLVRLAGGTFTNVVGVVESHLALTQKPSHPQPAEGEPRTEALAFELRSVAGLAQAGDYVAITVMGAAQVKADDAASIEAGQRLTVAETPGHARVLRTVQVEGVKVDESGPTLGVALEAAKDGLVWVLVNPQ